MLIECANNFNRKLIRVYMKNKINLIHGLFLEVFQYEEISIIKHIFHIFYIL